MFSTTTIDGAPRVLFIDASHDLSAWEAAFCKRLFTSMAGRGVALAGDAPAVARVPDDLGRLVEAVDYNCVCLFGPNDPKAAPPLIDYMTWLDVNVTGPKLLTACAWEGTPPQAAERLASPAPSFASIALAPSGPVSPRQAGLGMLKFYAELALHTEGAAATQTTGRMAWFAWRKAKELLTRRGFDGDWVLRS